MRTALIIGLVFACALGAFSVTTHVAVYVALRRAGVPFSSVLSGMPGYMYARCHELPPSPQRGRLLKLSYWSNVAFGVALLGGIIFGLLLASR